MAHWRGRREDRPPVSDFCPATTFPRLRMPVTSPALIAATILISSFLSGVFGMAGGMILLGVLLIYFDVTVAMVLFSIITFASNGWRAVLWWRYVRRSIVFHYGL